MLASGWLRGFLPVPFFASSEVALEFVLDAHAHGQHHGRGVGWGGLLRAAGHLCRRRIRRTFWALRRRKPQADVGPALVARNGHGANLRGSQGDGAQGLRRSPSWAVGGGIQFHPTLPFAGGDGVTEEYRDADVVDAGAVDEGAVVAAGVSDDAGAVVAVAQADVVPRHHASVEADVAIDIATQHDGVAAFDDGDGHEPVLARKSDDQGHRWVQRFAFVILSEFLLR